MKKRIFPLLLALAMVLGLAACGNGKSNESQTPGPDGTADADGIKFAIMFGVGGLGDNAFNDEVNEGCQMAVEQLGVSYDYC